MELIFDAYYEQGRIYNPAHKIPKVPEGKILRFTVTDAPVKKAKKRTGYAKEWEEILKEIEDSDEVLEGEPERLNFRTNKVAQTL